MEIFGFQLDIESIELWYIEPKEERQFGIGTLLVDTDPEYFPESNTLRFSLEFQDSGMPYQYEYVIQQKEGGFLYREIQTQKEGYEGFTGKLELLESNSQLVFLDQGDEGYRYYFHIAKSS